MKILDKRQITQKIKRLAIEILEKHYDEPVIYLVGVNKNGVNFAKLIATEIGKMNKTEVKLLQVQLRPEAPLSEPITLSEDPEKLVGQVAILVDDVANTGRTLFYAMKPLLQIIAKKVEVAVLVDRKHKSVPIRPDYVGLSLATTLMENIDVQLTDARKRAVYLN